MWHFYSLLKSQTAQTKSIGYSIWVLRNDAFHGQLTSLQCWLCFTHMWESWTCWGMAGMLSFHSKNCCQDVFDQGSESPLWWICLVADNKNLQGLENRARGAKCNIMKGSVHIFRQLLSLLLRMLQSAALRKRSIYYLVSSLTSQRLKQPNIQPLVYGTERFFSP